MQGAVPPKKGKMRRQLAQLLRGKKKEAKQSHSCRHTRGRPRRAANPRVLLLQSSLPQCLAKAKAPNSPVALMRPRVSQMLGIETNYAAQ